MNDDNTFEPPETPEEQNRRVGAQIRKNADNRAAAALVGRRVRFRHEPATSAGYMVTMARAGMVELDGWTGEFSPYIFETIDSDDPRAR